MSNLPIPESVYALPDDFDCDPYAVYNYIYHHWPTASEGEKRVLARMADGLYCYCIDWETSECDDEEHYRCGEDECDNSRALLEPAEDLHTQCTANYPVTDAPCGRRLIGGKEGQYVYHLLVSHNQSIHSALCPDLPTHSEAYELLAPHYKSPQEREEHLYSALAAGEQDD